MAAGHLVQHHLRHRFAYDFVFKGFTDIPPRRQVLGVPNEVARRIRSILLARGLFKNNYAFVDSLRGDAARLLERVAAENDPAEAEPIPTVELRDLTPDAFRREFVDSPHPVVIKGFTTRASDWTVEWFIERYGDIPVIFTDLSVGSDYEAPLRSVRGDAARRNAYIHNCGRIFVDHPQLFDDLEVDRLAALIGKRCDVTQVFVGARKGSGTGFHCANNFNFFYQIQGRKRWTFVDPAHTLLMYPWLIHHAKYQTSLVGLPAEDGPRDLPLYRYCPRYTTVLEEGDVLLNPPWWYHAVENVTEETVGVATRWPAGDRLTNRLFTYLLNHTVLTSEAIPKLLAGELPPNAQLWFEESAHGGESPYEVSTNPRYRRSWGL